MAKSVQIDCTTGKQIIVDIPDEIKPIEENPIDEIKEKSRNRRQKAMQLLGGMDGKDINNLSKSEQSILLIALCQIMNIADENNVIDMRS